MIASLKANWKQLAVAVLSILVALGLHFGKLTVDQAIGLGGVAGAFGLHLPAFVYKVPPIVTAIGVFVVGAFALSLVMLACAASTVPDAEYAGQLKACDDTSTSRSQDDNCKTEVRNHWNEAGAPPAAILDGGAQ